MRRGMLKLVTRRWPDWDWQVVVPLAFIVPNNWSVAAWLPQKLSNCYNCPWHPTKSCPTTYPPPLPSDRAGSKTSASSQAFTYQLSQMLLNVPKRFGNHLNRKSAYHLNLWTILVLIQTLAKIMMVMVMVMAVMMAVMMAGSFGSVWRSDTCLSSNPLLHALPSTLDWW